MQYEPQCYKIARKLLLFAFSNSSLQVYFIPLVPNDDVNQSFKQHIILK